MRSFRSKGKAMEQFKAKLLTVFAIGLFTGLVLHGVYTGKPSGVLIITDNLLEYNRMGSLVLSISLSTILRISLFTLGSRAQERNKVEGDCSSRNL